MAESTKLRRGGVASKEKSRKQPHGFFNPIAAVILGIVGLFSGFFTHTPPQTSPQPAAVVLAGTASVPTKVLTIVKPIVTEPITLAASTYLKSAAPADPPRLPPDSVLTASVAPSNYITHDELAAQLQIATNALRSFISQNESAQNSPIATGGFTNEIAASNKIDRLSGTILNNVTVSGVSGLTASDIPTNITAANYLPLAGGTLTGDLTVTGNFNVSGAQTLSGAITIPYLAATSTTFDSTFIRLTATNATTTNATSTSLFTSTFGLGSGNYFTSLLGAGLAKISGALSLDLTHANIWTGFQQFFGNASTTQLSANSAYFGGTATSTFTSAGWLGIGTTSPSTPLEVNGTITAVGSLHANSIYLSYANHSESPWIWYIGQNAGWLSGIDTANTPTLGDFVPIFKCQGVNGPGTACTGGGEDFMYVANNQDGLSTVSPVGGATGTGYSLPCTVTLDDTGGQSTGDIRTRAQVTVTSVGGTGGSQITGVSIAALGKYIVDPSTPTNQFSATCGGTGATFVTTWTFNHPTMQLGEGSQGSQNQVLNIVSDPTNPQQRALQLTERSPGGIPLIISPTLAGSDGPTQDVEFLSNNANWTSTGWTGSQSAGWTAGGNTNVLSYSTAAVVSTHYQIQTVVTGTYGTGTVTVAFGGQTESLTALGTTNWGPIAITTGNLTITPPATFTGKIAITIFPITAGSVPSLYISDSSGGSALEIRESPNALQSTFIGYSAGVYNTTGSRNTAFGVSGLNNNSTGSNDSAVGYAALAVNTVGSFNSAFGSSALGANVEGNRNTAVGYAALVNNTASFNTAIGDNALQLTTIGVSNTAVGDRAMVSNVSNNYNTAVGALALYTSNGGSANSAFGFQALNLDLSGVDNTALGYQSLQNNTASSNTAVGSQSLQNNTSGAQNTAVGKYALINLVGAFSNDVAFGFNAGRYYNGTTGNLTQIANSTLLGTGASALNATGDTNETVIGYNAIGNGSNSTTIGNSSVTSTIIPAGNVGIGTTTPYSRLSVWGPDSAATTSAFAVINNASTTVFSVYDNGNATYSGSIFQSSDQRLKTNILSLDAPSSLSAIEALNPVSYTRLDQADQGQNLGFIAQEVQQTFPQLVSTTSATALTPDGTLTLNYVGLIAPMVKAIQGIAHVTGAFKDALVAWLGDASNGIHDLYASVIHASSGNFSSQLCVGTTCVTPAQFQAMVAAAGQTGTTSSSGQGSDASSDSTASSTSDASTTPTTSTNGDTATSTDQTASTNAQ